MSTASDSDIESTAPEVSRTRPGYINAPKAVIDKFEAATGLRMSVAPSLPFHPHPNLYWGRLCAEQAMHSMVRRANLRQVAVGANPSSLYRDNVDKITHAMIPILQQGDATRFASRRVGLRFCQCRCEECACDFDADVATFVHSAYYVGLSAMVDFVGRTKSKEALVVGHLFPDGFGKLGNGELTYKYGKGIVTCTVKGNTYPYVHPPLPWDFGQLPVRQDGWGFDVVELARYGDTYLWRCTLVRRAAPVDPVPVPLTELSRGNGPIELPEYLRKSLQNDSVISTLRMGLPSATVFGGLLVIAERDVELLVPLPAIPYVASMLAGQPRSTDTLNTAFHHARIAVKNSHMPIQDQPAAISAAAILGFNYGVQTEMELLTEATSRFGRIWAVHNRLLLFAPVKRIRLLYVIFALAVVLIAGGLALRGPAVVEDVGIATMALAAFGLLCVAGGWWALRYTTTRRGDAWSRTLDRQGLATPLLPQIIEGGRMAFAPPFEVAAPPPDFTGRVEFVAPLHERKQPGRRNPTQLLEGVAVSNRVPTVLEPGLETELSGLQNRVMRAFNPIDAFILDAYYDVFNDSERFRPHTPNYPFDHTEEAFSRWLAGCHYPKNVKDRLIRARKECQSAAPRVTSIASTFIKVEKGKPRTEEGAPVIKPRIIQSVSDHVKAITGPAFAWCYNHVKRYWDGVRMPILYASGRAIDNVGSAIQSFIDRHEGNVVGYSNDYAVFDGSIRLAHQGPVRTLMMDWGVPEEVLTWDANVETKGTTPAGIRYKAPKDPRTTFTANEINSGEQGTNFKGTVINAASISSWAKHRGIATTEYLLVVSGDDALLLVARKSEPEDGEADLESWLTHLGLRPKLTRSLQRSDWEFCSKVLWYATDPKTGQRVCVPGPKPGRLLSRIGWSLTRAGAMNFPAAIAALADDCAHIPLLGVVLAHFKVLTAGRRKKGREWADMHVSRRFDPHPDNVALFCERYAASITELNDTVALYQSITTLPARVSSPFLSRIVDRDGE